MLTKQSQVLIEIEKADTNCIIERTVYMRAHKVGNRNITIKVCKIISTITGNIDCINNNNYKKDFVTGGIFLSK